MFDNMEENSNYVAQFESILSNQSTNALSRIYEDRNTANSSNNRFAVPLNCGYVIGTISKQLNAIQKAETLKIESRNIKTERSLTKSCFVPLNEISKDVVLPPPQLNTYNFDTQMISGTQLVNIIHDAEAISSNNGMTQEFETSFNHSPLDEAIGNVALGVDKFDDSTENMEVDISTEVMLSENDKKKSINDGIPVIDNREHVREEFCSETLGDFTRTALYVKENAVVSVINDGDDDQRRVEDDDTEAIDKEDDADNFENGLGFKFVDISLKEPNNQLIDDEVTTILEDNDLPCSPVFSVKPVKRFRENSPLSFDLKAFEDFENAAFPIIEKGEELDAVKINSQIINTELSISNNTKPIKIKRHASPVIPISETFVINKSLQLIIDKAKSDVVLEDEILFSSDEENGHTDGGDIFTCILDNIYEDSDFDDPVYDGIHTKNLKEDDKTIMVKEDSLQESLNEDVNRVKTSANINNGVLKFEGETSNSQREDQVNLNTESENPTAGTDVVDNVDEIDPNFNTYTELQPNKNEVTSQDTENSEFELLNEGFKGFQTDSNKAMKQMESILNKYKLFFHGDGEKHKKDTDFCTEYDKHLENKHKKDCIEMENEELVDQSLLEEFENFEMKQEVKKNEDGTEDRHKNHNRTDNEPLSNMNTEMDFQIDNTLVTTAEIQATNPVTDETSSSKDNNAVNSYRVEILSSIPAFCGFKTASNKEVKISEKALAKSRKRLEHISNLVNKEEESETGVGFKISSNKKDYIPSSVTATSITVPISEQQFKNTKIEEKVLELDTKDNFLKPNSYIHRVPVAVNKTIKNHEPDLTDTGEVLPSTSFVGLETTNNNDRNEVAVPNILETFDHGPPIIGQEDGIPSTNFTGFKTASNKAIEISAVALAQSRKKIEAAYAVVASSVTASDKTSDIPKDSMVKSRKVQVEDNNDKVDGFHKPAAKFEGFKTANNKKVIISEKALTESRKTIENAVNKEMSEHNQPFCGFRTGNNNKIKISEITLAKSRKIIQNLQETTDRSLDLLESSSYNEFQTVESRKVEDRLNINDKAAGLNKPVIIFKGFQTASNKKVEISEKALAESRKIIENANNVVNKEMAEQYQSFCGFKTANNKNVTVSEAALAKSRKLIQNLQKTTDRSLDLPVPSTSNAFQIVESRKVEDRHNFNDKSDGFNKLSIKFEGFQTASNKKVEISEKALIESRKIIENTVNVVNKEMTEQNQPFCGFKTANNTNVKISETALANSRKLIQDLQKITDRSLDLPKSSISNAFQTASNKNVTIIETALAESRQILNDIPTKAMNASQTITKEKNEATRLKKPALPTKENFNFKRVIQTITKSEDIDVNVNNLIDTQVINNFEESMTEDLSKVKTPIKSKRSGSPILSCPKAKRRKFEAPYNLDKYAKSINVPGDVAVADIDLKSAEKAETNAIEFAKDYKKNKRYTLKDLDSMEKNTDTQSCIDPNISNFKFDNLLDFEFKDRRNDILVSNKTITIENLRQLFLNYVNNKLVPEGWIENHLKLILWKLLSYEVSFPKTMANVCTAKNVLDQLKYRYDKELFNAERPALRKIFEKDDVSTRTLVLCVVDIIEDKTGDSAQQKPPDLLLTDGWYTIRATTDRLLSTQVVKGKIVVGTKLVTSGAELVNCEQGVAPWEDTSSIRLTLSGNSTRRAPWLSPLGCQPSVNLTALTDVSCQGGKVARMRVCVTRRYPALYVDRCENGSTVTRSERLELLYQEQYESQRQMMMERIYEELEKEYETQESQDSDCSEPSSKRICLEAGLSKRKMYNEDLTPSQTRNYREEQIKKLEKRAEVLRSRFEERLANEERRRVISVVRVRIASGGSKAMLSIWKPGDAVLEIVKEGACIEIHNVMPTAIRNSELQLSAGRQSVFRESKFKTNEIETLNLQKLQRKCYTIQELTKNPNLTTEYNEIDTVGFIFLIDPPIKKFDSKKNQFQNMFLADVYKNIICVNFWGGLKKFGYENFFDISQIIYCVNLQKRVGNSRKSIPHYRATEYTYFTKTPKNYIARTTVEEMTKKMVAVNKTQFCQDCISLRDNFTVLKASVVSENVSPYRFQGIDLNLSKNKIFIDSPLALKKDADFNLTGLDFDSSFKQNTQELSPKTLLRKNQVKERLNKLKMYGEPPPLSPIQILNKSKNAGSAFKSPFSKSDVCSSATICEKNLPNTQEMSDDDILMRSPDMNRTFVKRINVNPVKLNFSSNILEDIKCDFDEDYDGSPPLSLD